jgi:hypothetical protein
MSQPRRAGARPSGGSRYLYDSFDIAQARIEAQERLADERRAGLEYRLGRIETALERLEKRLWLAVYGVAAAVLVHGALAMLGTRI